MKESVRRALNVVVQAAQIEVWIENILFLILVLIFLGFVLYRGWLSLHLR